MTDVKSALKQACAQLENLSPSARIDAEVLLTHVMAVSRTFLYTYPETEMSAAQHTDYLNLITQRQTGVPIAYLTGTREFWSLPIQVNSNTLIPRADTELLVELALSLLGNKSTATVLDLGTGSGAIALALASERADWQIIAADISEEAVSMARANAARLRLANVQVYQSNWFASLPIQGFDAILSNPPYLAEQDPHLLRGDLRFEPRQALVSGTKGLDALNDIIQYSDQQLLPEGLLLLEHGYDQKDAVLQQLNQCGYQDVMCWQDCQGNDRVSGGFKKNKTK